MCVCVCVCVCVCGRYESVFSQPVEMNQRAPLAEGDGFPNEHFARFRWRPRGSFKTSVVLDLVT